LEKKINLQDKVRLLKREIEDTGLDYDGIIQLQHILLQMLYKKLEEEE